MIPRGTGELPSLFEKSTIGNAKAGRRCSDGRGRPMFDRDGRTRLAEGEAFCATAGAAQAHIAAHARILKRLMRDPPSNPRRKPLVLRAGSRPSQVQRFGTVFRADALATAIPPLHVPNDRVSLPDGSNETDCWQEHSSQFAVPGLALSVGAYTRMHEQGQVWRRAREEGPLLRPGRHAGIRRCRNPYGVSSAHAPLSSGR
jgi:hypothetical protein